MKLGRDRGRSRWTLKPGAWHVTAKAEGKGDEGGTEGGYYSWYL